MAEVHLVVVDALGVELELPSGIVVEGIVVDLGGVASFVFVAIVDVVSLLCDRVVL